jgi:hypothetical protein
MTDQAERFLLAAANDFEGMTVAEIKAQLASVVPQVIQYGNAICRAEKRIDDADKRTELFCAQVTKEHADTADALKQLLTILTELVQTLKNDRQTQGIDTGSA